MTKKSTKKKKPTTENDENEIPFKSNYDDLVTFKTLSKRGLYWTAVLVVQAKAVEEGKAPKKKIIIQRYKKIKPSDESIIKNEYWKATKNFTLSSVKLWNELSDIVNTFIETKEWE